MRSCYKHVLQFIIKKTEWTRVSRCENMFSKYFIHANIFGLIEIIMTMTHPRIELNTATIYNINPVTRISQNSFAGRIMLVWDKEYIFRFFPSSSNGLGPP